MADDPPGAAASDDEMPGGSASESPGDPETAPPAGRRSVAATRRAGSNKLTLILGGISLIVMVAVVILGFWLNAKANAVPDDGYGHSTASTVSVGADGEIIASTGDAPLVIDLYEDPMDSDCAEFEEQFRQQIAKAVDQGKLTVHYRFVDFLNNTSPSGDYSTRADAALLTVARIDGDKPGVWMRVHDAFLLADNQPTTIANGGKSDPDNAALAALAGRAGASQQAQQQIAAGADVAAAGTDAKHQWDALKKLWATVGGTEQTPSVGRDGTLLSLDGADWLTKLLGEQ